MAATSQHHPFGNQVPFCEPSWYQGGHSPYYRASHVALRDATRKLVDAVNDMDGGESWITNGYPPELHELAYKAGVQGVIYPNEWGGSQPDDFDAFHEVILWDELGRLEVIGTLGQMAISSMALPPIVNYGSQFIKEKVLNAVIEGRSTCSLAISEPGAGSDVSNIATTAKRLADGSFVVNGQKKWITGGSMADFFTLVVRTGGPGAGGLSLLLLERGMKGVGIRKMHTMFDNANSTTFVTLDDVHVPANHLIGKEGEGFKYIMTNFNHERLVIAAGAARNSRMCYEESFTYAMTRKTFGKRLIDHQMIRFKFAEMARQIEALQCAIEHTAFQFSQGVPDKAQGMQCALLKVQASKTYEYCAREAAQVFGGSALVKEGQGKMVESLYRNVRNTAIPGGSEEVLLDFAIRMAMRTPAVAALTRDPKAKL